MVQRKMWIKCARLVYRCNEIRDSNMSRVCTPSDYTELACSADTEAEVAKRPDRWCDIFSFCSFAETDWVLRIGLISHNKIHDWRSANDWYSTISLVRTPTSIDFLRNLRQSTRHDLHTTIYVVGAKSIKLKLLQMCVCLRTALALHFRIFMASNWIINWQRRLTIFTEFQLREFNSSFWLALDGTPHPNNKQINFHFRVSFFSPPKIE